MNMLKRNKQRRKRKYMFTRETAHLDLAYTLDLCSSF